jgi:hypothetical protein
MDQLDGSALAYEMLISDTWYSVSTNYDSCASMYSAKGQLSPFWTSNLHTNYIISYIHISSILTHLPQTCCQVTRKA